MSDLTPFAEYNLVVGALAAGCLVYLLFRAEPRMRENRRFGSIVAGLSLFVIGGPVVDVVSPRAVHWIHGLAAAFVVLGLYSPVRSDVHERQSTTLLLTDPTAVRRPAEWMTPIDDDVLELLDDSGLVVTPAVVALNIDRSRAEVNRRLGRLEEHGLVERVARGKYRITDRGDRYLGGTLRFDDP